MSHRVLYLTFLPLILLAADKKLPIEQSSNELVEISATVTLDLDQIVELHEKSAVSAIQFLLSGQNVNPDVRQRAQWALKQLQ